MMAMIICLIKTFNFMHKSFYLFTVIFLTITSFLKANETESSSVEENIVAAEPTIAPKPMPDVPENELIEMVGYLTALNGGIHALKLDNTEIKALAEGLRKGISGEWSLEAFPEDAIREAFAQAQSRAVALEKGEIGEPGDESEPNATENLENQEDIKEEVKELPVIDPEALQKIGLVLVHQLGLSQLKFDTEDAVLVAKGFIAGSSATELNPEIEAKMPALQAFIKARIDKAKKAFFEDLVSKDAEVQISETGLHYKIIEPGLDEKPTLEDTVLVHYKGTLIDGTKFDSSYDRGEPSEFPLSGVVAGFGEGLTKIGAGGKIILYIPSELGYGNTPRPGGLIKPGDTLIFECELIEVNPQ